VTLRFQGLGHVFRSPAGESRRVLMIGDFQLEPGDQLLVRGVSGSGKTTLFNILAGLLRPTEGEVYYDHQALYALPEAARDRFRAGHIGYVFQNHLLLPYLSAVDNIVVPLAFARRYPARDWKPRAKTLLAQLGMADHLEYRPRALSTGQRLRVAIARALANSPAVLLADEPTAALDADAASQVMDLLQTTCREHQAILIVASHDPALSGRFAQVCDLRAGQLHPGTGAA
jgi:putative ABC transport system ATP-binding protein